MNKEGSLKSEGIKKKLKNYEGSIMLPRKPDKEIKTVLDQLENAELYRIQKDLKDFQTARRRLIIKATNINVP